MLWGGGGTQAGGGSRGAPRTFPTPPNPVMPAPGALGQTHAQPVSLTPLYRILLRENTQLNEFLRP